LYYCDIQSTIVIPAPADSSLPEPIILPITRLSLAASPILRLRLDCIAYTLMLRRRLGQRVLIAPLRNALDAVRCQREWETVAVVATAYSTLGPRRARILPSPPTNCDWCAIAWIDCASP